MGLLSWAGRIIGLRDGQFWANYFGGENWAGKPVTEVTSLQLSAWWRAVRLYADVVGALPLKFYERKDDDRRPVPDHRVALLIGQDPNDELTAQEFWSSIAAGLAISGNAFAEKGFVGGNVTRLDPLPYYVETYRDENNSLFYRYSDRGKTVVLPAEKVFHVRGFTLGWSDLGLSPLAAGRQALSISLATDEAAGKTFAHGMRASGFFTLPPGMKSSPESRADFRRTFIDPMTGNNADVHVGLLEGGIDFKTINISPKDAEMLLSRKFNIEEIARFMGVPPILIGHSDEGHTNWGTGVEALINMWLTLGLNSFLTYIEKAINKRLLVPAERTRYYAEFERNALLRVDSAARGELYWKLAQLAAMTPNQICDRENMPRFPDGDVRLVNSTLMPLDQAMNPPVPPSQPNAGLPQANGQPLQLAKPKVNGHANPKA